MDIIDKDYTSYSCLDCYGTASIKLCKKCFQCQDHTNHNVIRSKNTHLYDCDSTLIDFGGMKSTQRITEFINQTSRKISARTKNLLIEGFQIFLSEIVKAIELNNSQLLNDLPGELIFRFRDIIIELDDIREKFPKVLYCLSSFFTASCSNKPNHSSGFEIYLRNYQLLSEFESDYFLDIILSLLKIPEFANMLIKQLFDNISVFVRKSYSEVTGKDILIYYPFLEIFESIFNNKFYFQTLNEIKAGNQVLSLFENFLNGKIISYVETNDVMQLVYFK